MSCIQEKEVARKLGGNLISGSGCGQFNSGDVETETFLIECKTITKPQTSFSIKKEWLDKVSEQAFEQGKLNYALAFRFEPQGKDFIVLPIDIFKDLIDTEGEIY